MHDTLYVLLLHAGYTRLEDPETKEVSCNLKDCPTGENGEKCNAPTQGTC